MESSKHVIKSTESAKPVNKERKCKACYKIIGSVKLGSVWPASKSMVGLSLLLCV